MPGAERSLGHAVTRSRGHAVTRTQVTLMLYDPARAEGAKNFAVRLVRSR